MRRCVVGFPTKNKSKDEKLQVTVFLLGAALADEAVIGTKGWVVVISHDPMNGVPENPPGGLHGRRGGRAYDEAPRRGGDGGISNKAADV